MTAKNGKRERPTLYLVGSGHGPPSLDDLEALFKRLAGREPAAEDIERARRTLEQGEQGGQKLQ